MRLTKKTKLLRGYTRDFAISNVIYEMTYKLGQLEDLMQKYNFENVEDLDNFIQSCINRIKYENKKEKLL